MCVFPSFFFSIQENTVFVNANKIQGLTHNLKLVQHRMAEIDAKLSYQQVVSKIYCCCENKLSCGFKNLKKMFVFKLFLEVRVTDTTFMSMK